MEEFTLDQLADVLYKEPTEYTLDDLANEQQIIGTTREIMENLGDRRRVLKAWRGATPEHRTEILATAPGVGEELRARRPGAVGRTLGALSRGASHAIAQPIMELTGTGGTKEEIDAIRQFDAIASQTFNPSTPQDPWYERGPLQAVEMAPWMAEVIGGGAAAQGVTKATGLASAMSRLFGMGRTTLRAAQMAGITAAGFPQQYAQELDSFRQAGVGEGWKLNTAAALNAAAVSAIEGIVPNPFKVGAVPLNQGAAKAARTYLTEALKSFHGEFREEVLQGLQSGMGRSIMTYLDENAPNQGLGSAFQESWNQGTEAILPLAFMLGVPAVGGAGLSAARANRVTQLQNILAKGWVTGEEGKALGLSPDQLENRATRKAAVVEEMQQAKLEQNYAEHVRQSTLRQQEQLQEESETVARQQQRFKARSAERLEQELWSDPMTAAGWAENDPEAARTLAGKPTYLPRDFEEAGLPVVPDSKLRRQWKGWVQEYLTLPEDMRAALREQPTGRLSDQWSRVPDDVQVPESPRIEKRETPFGTVIRVIPKSAKETQRAETVPRDQKIHEETRVVGQGGEEPSRGDLRGPGEIKVGTEPTGQAAEVGVEGAVQPLPPSLPPPATVSPTAQASATTPPVPTGYVRFYRADAGDAVAGYGWARGLDYVEQKYGTPGGSTFYIDVPEEPFLSPEYGGYVPSVTGTQTLEFMGIDVRPKKLRVTPERPEQSTTVSPTATAQPASVEQRTAQLVAIKTGRIRSPTALVDEMGQPPRSGFPYSMQMWHGTGRTEDMVPIYAEGASGPALGPGRYTALDARSATNYGPNVEQVDVHLDNPAVITSDRDLERWIGERLQWSNELRSIQLTKARKAIEAAGHDGVIVEVDFGQGDVDSKGESHKRLGEIFGHTQVIEFGKPVGAVPPAQTTTPPAAPEPPTAAPQPPVAPEPAPPAETPPAVTQGPEAATEPVPTTRKPLQKGDIVSWDKQEAVVVIPDIGSAGWKPGVARIQYTTGPKKGTLHDVEGEWLTVLKPEETVAGKAAAEAKKTAAEKAAKDAEVRAGLIAEVVPIVRELKKRGLNLSPKTKKAKQELLNKVQLGTDIRNEKILQAAIDQVAGEAEKLATEAAQTTIEPSELRRRLRSVDNKTNRRGYEPLSDVKAAELVSGGYVHGKGKRKGRLTDEGYRQLREFERQDKEDANAEARAVETLTEQPPAGVVSLESPAAKPPEEPTPPLEPAKLVRKPGAKPTLPEFTQTMVDAGQIRQEDVGKRQFAFTFRDRMPNAKWLAANEISDKLSRTGAKDSSTWLKDSLRPMVDAGLLDQMFRPDGTPVYAWAGTQPTAELVTVDQFEVSAATPQVEAIATTQPTTEESPRESAQRAVASDRPPLSELGASGSEAGLVTAEGKTRKVRYIAVEADEVIPSHDARRAFTRNEGGDENERPYHDPKQGAASRQVVLDIAKMAEPDKIALLVSDTRSPTDGPPITTDTGVVLGGNARLMGMQLAYYNGGDAANRLKQTMVDAAGKFGIDPQSIAGMLQPVIVRVLDQPGERGEISALLNESLAAGKSQATVAASQGKRVSVDTATKIATMLEPEGLEDPPTIREVLSKPAKADRIVQMLRKDGAWSDREIDLYVDPTTNTLNADGKAAIEQLLIGKLISDPSVAGNASPGVRQKLLAAIGPLARGMSDKTHGARLTQAIQDAVQAFDSYKSEGVTLDQYFMKQRALFAVPGHGDYAVAGIVHALDILGPRKFKNVMNGIMQSLGIKSTTPTKSLFAETEETVDTLEEAVEQEIKPPLKTSARQPKTSAPSQRVSGGAAKPAEQQAPEAKPTPVTQPAVSQTLAATTALQQNQQHRKALDDVLGDYGPSGKYGDANDAAIAKRWDQAPSIRWTLAKEEELNNPLFSKEFNSAQVGEYFAASQSTGQGSRLPYAILYKASDTAAVYVTDYSSLTPPVDDITRLNKMGLPKVSVSAEQQAQEATTPTSVIQRGVSGEASKPSDRPSVTPKPGSATGAMLQPVQMPELFQIAKELMEGKAPHVKKLREAAGRFKGMEGIGPLAILIDPSTAADEQALAQTMSHEIGHLTDFLSENTLRRGNLLGRLQSLRNFLKSTMPPLDAKDQARIRREAKKEAGKDATREEVDVIYQRMLKDRGLLANTVIRNELLDLTKWWSGDFAGGKDSYVKYRESARELYAEALSVFLNSPGDLESRAPVFYQTLLEHLDAKPDVLEAYSTLQQMLNGTGQELAESRTQTLREMYGSANELMNHLRMAQEQRRKTTFAGIVDFLGQYFLTSGQPVFTRLGRKPIKRGESAEAAAARFALDELFTIDSPNHTFLRNIDEQVYQPLIKVMQQRGLDRKQAEAEADFTLGEYLFHWRVANERDAIANPAGFTATPSRVQLEAIKTRIGDDAYAKLQDYALRFHALVYARSEEATNEGVYNRESFDNTVTPNQNNYAAFRVTHHVDDPDIIATGIIKQIGTFSDIQNPYHATVLKVVRLNRLIELNRAKNRVRKFLEKNFPGDITPVEMVFAGEGRPRIPKKKPGKGKEHLIELVDGHPVYFEVPTNIAKSFLLHDIGGLGQAAALINSATYKVFHPFFVTYNPGFVLANPFRDLRRTWVNLGATDNISLGKLLYEWARALPTAVRREKGLEDSVIREMIDSHALDIPYTDVAAEGIDSQIDQLFQKYGLREEKKGRLESLPVIGKVLQLIEHAGAVTETASKVAGWRVLEEKGVPVQERSYRVRKYVGTPDYKQRGLATVLTNFAMMYSRVRWNGLQADIGLATNPDTAAGWWWRQVVNVIAPTSFAKLAAYGGLGYVLRAMFGASDDDDESAAGKVVSWTDEAGKRIAEYFLTDYEVLPLGVNQDGKAVFITVPRDDLGKFVARVWWHALDLLQLGAGQELRKGEGVRDVVGGMFTDVKEQLVPSLSPPLELINKWGQYAVKINPVDSFYNQQIIPQKEWTAGGWHADSKMIAWTLDEFGAPGAVIHYAMSPLLGESFETGISGGVEAVMKTAGSLTGLGRFLRVSDSGLTSDQWARLENADQEGAGFRLSLPDSAQDASTRRYFLMRREALGDALSEKEQNEAHGLNLFYNAAYVPLRKMIQEAETADGDSQQFRDDMKQAADDPMTLWKNPPESIAKNVAHYKQGVVLAAVQQPPDPKRYTPKTYQEKLDEYTKTLPIRVGRLKHFGPTHSEAQRLLVESYRQPDSTGKMQTESRARGQGLDPSYRDKALALAKLYGHTDPIAAFVEFRSSQEFQAWHDKWAESQQQ